MSGPNGIAGSRKTDYDRLAADAKSDAKSTEQSRAVAPWAKAFDGYASSEPIRLPGVSSRAQASKLDFDAVTHEIFRLKSDVATSATPASRQRLSQLQSEWVGMAKAAGIREPAGRLEVLTATREQITHAFLWSEAGGIVPRGELAMDGGKAFHESVRDGVTLMTRGFDALVASHRGEPEKQLHLLRRELGRLGDRSPCRDSDTVASLRERRDAIVAKRASEDWQRNADEAAKQPVIGLDGYVGTPADVALYETSEKVNAMSPGTPLGSIMATYFGGGDVQRMRHLGEAGNALETMIDRRGRTAQIPPAPERKPTK